MLLEAKKGPIKKVLADDWKRKAARIIKMICMYKKLSGQANQIKIAKTYQSQNIKAETVNELKSLIAEPLIITLTHTQFFLRYTFF